MFMLESHKKFKEQYMCAERFQRLMMATVLFVALMLFLNSYIFIATILQGFVIAMILAWGLFGFCPALWFLKKFLPSCKDD